MHISGCLGKGRWEGLQNDTLGGGVCSLSWFNNGFIGAYIYQNIYILNV